MASPVSVGASPLVERLEGDEQGAEVRAEGVQDERLPRDGHRVRDPGRLQGDPLDLRGRLGRALQRGGIRQLDVRDQVALVLDRDEPGGDAGHAEGRQAEQADVDQEHDRAQAEAPAHGLAIGPGRPIEGPVEGPEEPAQGPVHRPDDEPPERPAGDGAGEEQGEVDPPRQQRGLQAAGDSPRSRTPPARRRAGPAAVPAPAPAATRSPARRGGRRTTTAGPPCPRRRAPCSRPPKIQAARAGVMVMALTAEMSIDTEMVRANCGRTGR